ncbi:MAG: PspC domain-containing protein [Bacteroidetes bacterium]|nr:PspC domain-containing protein [Bacteroidota bacterium]MCL1969388.1 PspC domain-containing protein [Bacteroidota bacterium]
MNTKRLTRSATDKKIAGICGGLGEYFNVDPVIFRIIFCFLALCGGGGLLLYLIMLLVIPEKQNSFQDFSKQTEETTYEDMSDTKKKGRSDTVLIVLGAIFIIFGAMIFLFRALPCYSYRFFFPAVLVVGGILLVLLSKKH